MTLNPTRHERKSTARTTSSNRLGIITAVKGPLGFFTLVILIAESLFGLLLATDKVPDNMRGGLIWAMVALISSWSSSSLEWHISPWE